MKKPLIIANWKMKLGSSESLNLAKKLSRFLKKSIFAEVILCPSFTEIAMVSDILKNTEIKLGAQDCFWEESGAFTGEISPKVLKDYGVQYVIVGHSERRQYLGETDDMIHRKIRVALSVGITPVICVGETFDERQSGVKDITIIRQVEKAISGIWLNKMDKIIIAYEPIWVIGSGQAVDPKEAEHTHNLIRQTLYDALPDKVVDEQIRIIYGGSVEPQIVSLFLKQPTIDGVLVGGASLDSNVFGALIMAAGKI